MATTAVAFRRGNTEENNAFAGVEGEITVDITLSTLRVHNGNSVPGGTELARADLANTDTTTLATSAGHKGKNLLYTDLSNINDGNNLSQEAVGENLRNMYDLAKTDMSNVNTSSLAENRIYDKPLAYADMSNADQSNLDVNEMQNIDQYAKKDGTNLDTTPLTTNPAKGPALARVDMTNINTASLAEGRNNDKPLAYADLSNTNAEVKSNKQTETLLISDPEAYPNCKVVADAIAEIPIIPDFPSELERGPYLLSYTADGQMVWTELISSRKVQYDDTTGTLQDVSTVSDALLQLTQVKANSADVYTKSQVYNKTEIDAKLTSAMRFKGTVNTVADLDNIQNPQAGDMYNVIENDANYAWDGEKWDKLSETIDLSPYLTISDAQSTYATITTVNGKVNIQQGSTNNGKVMTVGSDGNLSPQNIPAPVIIRTW